jgi:aryl carrier-like protein
LAQVEENRAAQYKIEDEKNLLSRQLDSLLMSVYNEQNEKEKGADVKDQMYESLQESINSITDCRQRVDSLT